MNSILHTYQLCSRQHLWRPRMIPLLAPLRRVHSSTESWHRIRAGIQSWLTFSLTLYSTLQPNADGSLGSSAAPPPSNNTLRYNQIQVQHCGFAMHLKQASPARANGMFSFLRQATATQMTPICKFACRRRHTADRRVS